MEKKYDEFLNYNWNDSEEWKHYFNNLSDIPKSRDIVMKFRKRFYKYKIDPDFDDKYIPIRERENSEEHTHTNNCNHKTTANPQRKGLFDNLFSAIEGFVWIAFFFNMLVQNQVLQISLIPLTIRTLRTNKTILPRFTKDYLDGLLKNEYFHVFLYVIILLLQPINYLFLFPISATALYCVCHYFSNYLRIFTFLKKYFEKVTNKKETIESIRGFSFILIAVYSCIFVLIGWVQIPFTIFYLLFLRFLYSYNTHVVGSFTKINNSIELVQTKNNIPNFIKITLKKIANIITKIGQIKNKSN